MPNTRPTATTTPGHRSASSSPPRAATSSWGRATNSDGRASADLAAVLFPKRGRRAVVLCDGERPSRALLARWLEDADLFVCTDAAGRPYAELPRKPDLVIGDFDSLGAAAREEGLRFEHVPDQDSSDAEKALRHLAAAGCQEAALLGATGRRLDHTLYNVLLLGRFARTLRLCLVDDETLSVALHPAESYRWALPADTLFSLLPLGAPAAGVTLGGAKYTIENATIGIAGPSALSNRVAAPPLKLRFDSGLLLLCVPAASDRGARRSEA